MSDRLALAVSKPEPAAPVVTEDQIDLVKRTIAKDATDAELKLYLYDCARQGVHPLDRLLHFTKRGGKYVPVTSIDLMRIRAAETGEYAGSDDADFKGPEDKHGYPQRATVTVWRVVQGTRYPFTATARWDEYKPEQNDFQWKKMPHTMLAKCAEALALRKGFPRQLAGLYAKEEMDQAGPMTLPPDVDVTTGEVKEPTTKTVNVEVTMMNQPERTIKVPVNSPSIDTPDPKPKDQKTITRSQQAMLHGRMKELGWAKETRREWLKKHFQIEHTDLILSAEFDHILKTLEAERGEVTF